VGGWQAGGGRVGLAPHSCLPWKAAAAAPFQPPCAHPGSTVISCPGPFPSPTLGGVLHASEAPTVAGYPLTPEAWVPALQSPCRLRLLRTLPASLHAFSSESVAISCSRNLCVTSVLPLWFNSLYSFFFVEISSLVRLTWSGLI